jgi:hypothetical protein
MWGPGLALGDISRAASQGRGAWGRWKGRGRGRGRRRGSGVPGGKPLRRRRRGRGGAGARVARRAAGRRQGGRRGRPSQPWRLGGPGCISQTHKILSAASNRPASRTRGTGSSPSDRAFPGLGHRGRLWSGPNSILRPSHGAVTPRSRAGTQQQGAMESWARTFDLLQQGTKQRLTGLDQLQVGRAAAARVRARARRHRRRARRPAPATR